MYIFDDSQAFENLGLVVINKPPGVLSTPTSEVSYDPGLIVSCWLKEHYPGFAPAHRIDKYTSGVILGASNEKNQAFDWAKPRNWLLGNWATATTKIYLAVTPTPGWTKGQMVTCSAPIRHSGKPPMSAMTGFVEIMRDSGMSLVACKLLKSGRTHQIRQHSRHLGIPIIGDVKYGGEGHERGGQLLHSLFLRLTIPARTMTFCAELPDDMRYGFNWEMVDTREIANQALKAFSS